MIVVSSIVGGPGTLLALARGYFLMFGLLCSEETWRECAVYAVIVLSVVPFVLPFASGIILRTDFEPVARRVQLDPVLTNSTC